MHFEAIPQLCIAALGALYLSSCSQETALAQSPRPEHPLNEADSLEELQALLAPHSERHTANFGNGARLLVAGPEGTTWSESSGADGFPIEIPWDTIEVSFPGGPTLVATDDGAGNGELVVDGELHAGWTFALTEDGLATFPFGGPLLAPVDAASTETPEGSSAPPRVEAND